MSALEVSAAGIRPVILSGGGGTRLWPMSRAANPKQFLRLFGEQSMLQATAARCAGLMYLPPLVVATEEQRFFVIDQLSGSNPPVEAILLEPAARNTAPAIALAAHWLLARGEDDPMLVMPSDHLIRDEAALHEAVRKARPMAEAGKLVLFGVVPDAPRTGYGYIAAAPSEGGKPSEVRHFVEKPDAQTAAALVAQGGHYWNSGIFLFRPSVLLSELQHHRPDAAGPVARSMAKPLIDGRFVRPEGETFRRSPGISIDYAVMEHTGNAWVVPMDPGWSDVGSWDSLKSQEAADQNDNVIGGDVVAIDTKGTLIRNDSDLTVATVGLKDMIVVVGNDAVLVATLDQAQRTREVVDELRRRGHARADHPARVYRPWGSYQTVDSGEGFQTKRIIVNPGAKLSLQVHRHRSEHWVVVRGVAEVQVDGKATILSANQSTYIAAGVEHRLGNPGTEPLHLIEVQSGSYLGEDDIVRLDDDYGRSSADS